MSSPMTQHTEQLGSEAKIKNQGYQESGSSIAKTQIVESRKMDGIVKQQEVDKEQNAYTKTNTMDRNMVHNILDSGFQQIS